MILTIQQLVSGSPSGLERKVRFSAGGTLMQGEYDIIGPGEIRRAFSGKALDLTPYGKLVTSVSGSGWQSAGLDDLLRAKVYRTGFIKPLCQQSDGSAITPMRTARSDVAPYAFAVTASGVVKTTLTGWTPAAVAGALYYLIYFYPELDGRIRFKESLDQLNATYNWTLDFEEK